MLKTAPFSFNEEDMAEKVKYLIKNVQTAILPEVIAGIFWKNVLIYKFYKQHKICETRYVQKNVRKKEKDLMFYKLSHCWDHYFFCMFQIINAL